jgi:hypothetical protein
MRSASWPDRFHGIDALNYGASRILPGVMRTSSALGAGVTAIFVDLLEIVRDGRNREAIAWAKIRENGERLVQEWRRLNERE